MDPEYFKRIEDFISSSGEDLIPYELLNQYYKEKENREKQAKEEEIRIEKLRFYNERKGKASLVSRTSFCLNNDDEQLGTEFFFKTKNGYSTEILAADRAKRLEDAYLSGAIGIDKICNSPVTELDAFDNCTKHFCGEELFKSIRDEDRYVAIAVNEKVGNGHVAKYGALDILRGVGIQIGMFPSCKLLYNHCLGNLLSGTREEKFRILRTEFNSHRVGNDPFFICNLKVGHDGKVKIDSLSVNKTYNEHLISLKKKYGIID